MKTHRLVPVTALALVLLVPALAAAAERQWTQTYPLTADGRISLSNINGDVSIEGWDGAEVSVEALITGSSQEVVDELEIEVDASADRIDIETVYPRTGKGFWGRGQSAEVEYSLKVPRTAELDDISLVNGSLTIEGVAGEVEASLVNGDLTARGLAGDAELATVNGSLEVYFDRLGGDQSLDLESVNGSIDLYLPADADAEIDASTVHGRIRNDFGLQVDRGEYVGSDLHGRLGSGAASVSLENVNGSIDIRQN